MKMKQTIKRMVLTGAAVMVMVSLAGPATMAQEVVRDHRDGSSEEAGPVIRDHRDDSTSTVEEEDSAPHEPQVVCIKAPCLGNSDSTSTVEEEPYKDPGIRQCDIIPVECEGTDESGDSVVVRDHRDGGSKDEEAASAPGGVKVGVNNPSSPTAPKETVSIPADEAGQAANSGTTYDDTCAYDDYYFDEQTEMCWPNGMFLGVLFGDEPWPESAGGYVSLLGDFVQDPLVGLGLTLQAGLGHYVEDALVEWGEANGLIGLPAQGLGYTIGFLGDAAGTLVEGIGQVVGGATDVVGEVADGIGNAAEDAWDEVASWF